MPGKSTIVRFVATPAQLAMMREQVGEDEFEDMSKFILFAVAYYLRCEKDLELPPSRKRGGIKKTQNAPIID